MSPGTQVRSGSLVDKKTHREKSEVKARQKRRLTPEEIQGLKIVGSVLKATRLSQPEDRGTLRKFQAFLKDRTGLNFQPSSILRYEDAGTPKDWRSNSCGINTDYIEAVAPLSGFHPAILKQVALGTYYATRLRKDIVKLGDLIRQKEAQLGAKQFQRERQRWGVSEEELVNAKRGILINRSEASLAGLLGLQVHEVLEAALEQLREDHPLDDCDCNDN